MSESPVKNMYAEIQAGTDEKNSSSTIGPPTEIDSEGCFQVISFLHVRART